MASKKKYFNVGLVPMWFRLKLGSVMPQFTPKEIRRIYSHTRRMVQEDDRLVRARSRREAAFKRLVDEVKDFADTVFDQARNGSVYFGQNRELKSAEELRAELGNEPFEDLHEQVVEVTVRIPVTPKFKLHETLDLLANFVSTQFKGGIDRPKNDGDLIKDDVDYYTLRKNCEALGIPFPESIAKIRDYAVVNHAPREVPW